MDRRIEKDATRPPFFTFYFNDIGLSKKCVPFHVIINRLALSNGKQVFGRNATLFNKRFVTMMKRRSSFFTACSTSATGILFPLLPAAGRADFVFFIISHLVKPKIKYRRIAAK